MGVELINSGMSAQTFNTLGAGIVKLISLYPNCSYSDRPDPYCDELNTRIRSTANIPRQITTDDLWRHGHRVRTHRVLTSQTVVYRLSSWLNEMYSGIISGTRGCDPISAKCSLNAEHFLPRLNHSLSACYSEVYFGFDLGEVSCEFPDTNYLFNAPSLRRLQESHISPSVNFFLQKAALFHDVGHLLFTTNYDRILNSLVSSSPWRSEDRAEVLIENLRSKVNSFKTAIDSVWSSTKNLVDAGRNRLLSLTSYIARVVSKAQLLVDKFTKRISRLVKLRVRFITPQEQPPIFRTVVERRFFCIHGFHPPDLELPQNVFGFVFTGYVPGLLSI